MDKKGIMTKSLEINKNKNLLQEEINNLKQDKYILERLQRRNKSRKTTETDIRDNKGKYKFLTYVKQVIKLNESEKEANRIKKLKQIFINTV